MRRSETSETKQTDTIKEIIGIGSNAVKEYKTNRSSHLYYCSIIPFNLSPGEVCQILEPKTWRNDPATNKPHVNTHI